MRRAILAEAIGTALLLAAVVGSGIMAERLAAGTSALALLANAIATGAALVALIVMFGPISGAHFNPVVTLALACAATAPRALCCRTSWRRCGRHPRRLAGAPDVRPADPAGLDQGAQRHRPVGGRSDGDLRPGAADPARLRKQPAALPAAVAVYIVGAYWFTASTSFANPAVTIARSLSNTFAGILPADAPAFIVAQIVGAAAALLAAKFFEPAPTA